MDTDSRDELPSAAITSRPLNNLSRLSVFSVSSAPAALAVTPVTLPVRSSSVAPVTVTFSRSRAPAFSARLARISSKSLRDLIVP